MPLLDFSFSFRKGEVGGDRGFEAALAFRSWEAAASALEGEKRKTNITMHSTTPTTIVIGFVRRNDRAGPMASVFQVGVLNVWRRVAGFAGSRNCMGIRVARSALFVGRLETRSRPLGVGVERVERFGVAVG